MTDENSNPQSNATVKLLCPASKQPLSQAPPEIILRLNTLVDSKSLRFISGDLVETPFFRGLITADSSRFYPEQEGIQVLLADGGVEIP